MCVSKKWHTPSSLPVPKWWPSGGNCTVFTSSPWPWKVCNARAGVLMFHSFAVETHDPEINKLESFVLMDTLSSPFLRGHCLLSFQLSPKWVSRTKILEHHLSPQLITEIELDSKWIVETRSCEQITWPPETTLLNSKLNPLWTLHLWQLKMHWSRNCNLLDWYLPALKRDNLLLQYRGSRERFHRQGSPSLSFKAIL